MEKVDEFNSQRYKNILDYYHNSCFLVALIFEEVKN